MEKPKTIQSIIPEWALMENLLGIKRTKSGKCRIVSFWVRQGLNYVDISGQRYFFEQNLIDFFWDRYKRDA